MVDLDLGGVTTAKRIIDHILTADDTYGFKWDIIVLFMQYFGKELEAESPEEQQLIKKWNPERKTEIPLDRGLACLLEFIKQDEIIVAMETESTIMDPHTKGTVHHLEDFRHYLRYVGEAIPEIYIGHFIKEAQGRMDDLFDLNVYIENLCRTQMPEDPNAKKKQQTARR